MSGVRAWPGIEDTRLWKELETRLQTTDSGKPQVSSGFYEAVKKVCDRGRALAGYISVFFPQFTLHDETHIINVCEWMAKLLGDNIDKLHNEELALLLMSACCHDIGMAVSSDEEKGEIRSAVLKPGETAPDAKELGRRMRKYVREHHHERVGSKLEDLDWQDRELGFRKSILVDLCKSHGTSLDALPLPRYKNYDLQLCAVLLRLADILDFDPRRAPDVLFRHVGLGHPADDEEQTSKGEWLKNQAGYLEGIIRKVIPYTGSFDDPNVEKDVFAYLDWVEQELSDSEDYLQLHPLRDEMKGFELPHKIDRSDVERRGYSGGSFQLNMDQDGVLTLLSGESLYEDAGVFVRELLQNSIDAVLHRVKVDEDFKKNKKGEIHIHTWRDADGYDWFRIRDNGMGMSKDKIEKYFLKVGKSFYESKEYRDSVGEAGASAISRFGIGVLSCFMADPENNQLELSTLEKGSPAVRLSVPSLHGYYKLTESNGKVKPADMPHPPGEGAEAYRSEPGTSICVRTSLYRLGNYRSFREIIDKYLCFPEVQVLHVDETEKEKEKKYPTQQQLMDAVHALNNEKEKKIIEYVHPIPDAALEELKGKYPDNSGEWEKKPAIVFKYIPLDWYSDSEKLTGACIDVSIKASGFYGGFSWEKNGYVFYLISKNKKDGRAIPVQCEIPLKDFSTKERVFLDAMPLTDTAYAYNGIVAQASPLNSRKRQKICCLLHGNYRPDVDVGRNEIRHLPLELVCEFYFLPGFFEHIYFSFSDENEEYSSATEKEVIHLLETHESWEGLLFFDKHSLYEGDITLEDIRTKLSGREVLFLPNFGHRVENPLLFAALKKNFAVYFDGERFYIRQEDPDKDTENFPVGLFYRFIDGDSHFGYIKDWNYYNKDHPFSRWLIKNQEELQKRLPKVYEQIIRIMLDGDSPEIVKNGVNRELKWIKEYKNHDFHDTGDLFLRDEDFG
ncbi:MAG: ATP-binding protein [Bacillota bacterium]|nr:ATP-binding protein [Bacillota bacterium]